MTDSFTLVDGTPFSAVPITPNKLVGLTTLARLQAIGLRRPSEVENATKMSRKKEPTLAAAGTLRDQVQRRFDKARRERAELFAAYIQATEFDQKRNGGVPPITLYSTQPLTFNDRREAVLPFNTPVIAVDGETQLEARYLLADTHPETLGLPFAVTIYHGISEGHARQILHDVNAYATPIPERKTAHLNSEGALSLMVQEALSGSLPAIDLNTKGSTATQKYPFGSMSQALAFAAGFMLNSQAKLRLVSEAQVRTLNSTPCNDDDLLTRGADALFDALCYIPSIPSLGSAPPIVWQLGGVFFYENDRQPNWAGALAAFARTKTTGRGGARMGSRQRNTLIYGAM